MTAMLLFLLMGLAAFAVDVGHWYQVGQQEQAAADAAAMAGVTYLPGDSVSAFSTAKNYSKINGFPDGGSTTVTPALDGRPTRLRVTVSRTVPNFFGSLLGVSNTTVSRTAVADYSEPVPMGSPCNEFGNDPDLPATNRASACSGVLGQFWANVNSPGADKANGDAYQSLTCPTGGDGCTGSTNNDYATDGYYYTVSVRAPITGPLTIQLFDPVWVNTGLTCDTNFGSGTTAATAAHNDFVSDGTTRYAAGASGADCTGDNLYSGSQVMNTQFTVRDPGASPWDPSTFPVDTTCSAASGTTVNGVTTYPGYSGPLFNVLNKTDPKYNPVIANGFRRWTTLCTIASPVVGDYLIEVKTNLGGGAPTDNANAGNRFAIRAYGGAPGDKESLSVFGREKMSIYSNAPGVTTEFHLARIPSVDAGQILNVRLFDVGDSTISGTITVIYPPSAHGGPAGGSFLGCVGTGPASGPLTGGCSFTANSSFNGRWESVAVPIPVGYSCNDALYTDCWVRLQYNYGSGSQPTDVTSWTTSIQGDPVRLVE
jgi:hypothetical protein